MIRLKLLVLITTGLFLWLSGIIITPFLSGSETVLLQKLGAIGYFLYEPVCHQMVGRSFVLQGFSMAVCVRCFSVYLAGFIVVLNLFRSRVVHAWPFSVYLILLLPAVTDFFLEKALVYAQLPFIRFITGFLLGIAIFHLLIVSITAKPCEVSRADRQGHLCCKFPDQAVKRG